MCGITGFFGLNDSILIKNMNKEIEHRGPDGEGYYVVSKISLAHRRLSIIDLSEKGSQPMKHDSMVIVYNGEVYNFKDIREELIKLGYNFNSDTDTEVILKSYHMWGEACLEKFNGMFAFAIWDENTEELFCARDRLGIKPFYYYYEEKTNKLIFSSEIKPILKYPGYKSTPNDSIIYDYLYHGLIDHKKETFFLGINRLPAGSYLRIGTNEKMRITKYWDVNSFCEDKGKNDNYWMKKFRDLLEESVYLNMMSDVKLATSLSGGLDSTSIAAIIKSRLKNSEFQDTISYMSTLKDFDESEYILEFIELNQVNNKMIKKNSLQFIDDLNKLVRIQEEPFVSTGMYAGFSVMEKANQNGIKVMLNGQGADEILGGYRKYRIFYIKDMLRKLNLIKVLKSVASIKNQMGKSYNLKDDFNKFINIFKKNKNSGLADLMNKEFLEYSRHENLDNAKTFHDMHIKDILYTSLPSLLRYEDKNSMAWSIEARVPFLDHRLVELCLEMPIDYKMNGSWSKWVLRETMRDILPPKITKRKDKMGFVTEQSIWLYDNKEVIRELFSDDKERCKSYIDVKKLKEELDNLLEPQKGRNIWRIINLELWLREFF